MVSLYFVLYNSAIAHPIPCPTCIMFTIQPKVCEHLTTTLCACWTSHFKTMGRFYAVGPNWASIHTSILLEWRSFKFWSMTATNASVLGKKAWRTVRASCHCNGVQQDWVQGSEQATLVLSHLLWQTWSSLCSGQFWVSNIGKANIQYGYDG